MKGLILKDLLNLKKASLPMIFFLGIYFVIALFSGNSSFFTGIAMVFCAMLPISAISFDERSGFSKYVLTMPISRKLVVISRYLLSLCLIVIALLFSLIANIIIGDLSLIENVFSVLSLISVSLLIVSFSLPPIFKFGVEKGRYITIGICALMGAIAGVAFMQIGIVSDKKITIIGDTPSLIEDSSSILLGSYLVPIFLLASLVIFLSSMALSIKIYNNKDF
ncbi:MAG: ABC-2 transporter permease [Aminipila sp.]